MGRRGGNRYVTKSPARAAALKAGEKVYICEYICERCGTQERSTQWYMCLECNRRYWRDNHERYNAQRRGRAYPRPERVHNYEKQLEELWQRREDAWGHVWQALLTNKDVNALRRLLDEWIGWDWKLRHIAGKTFIPNPRLYAELTRNETVRAAIPPVTVSRY